MATIGQDEGFEFVGECICEAQLVQPTAEMIPACTTSQLIAFVSANSGHVEPSVLTAIRLAAIERNSAELLLLLPSTETKPN